jgi:CheY-like chemotaxis protein
MNERIDDPLLVVYDSRAIRETVSLLDPETCPHAVEVDDPGLALGMVEQHRPALAVLCAMTPKTRAYELCRRLKTHHEEELPVVIVSLQDREEIRQQAEAAGADEFFQLSISAEELSERIAALLEERWPRPQRPAASPPPPAAVPFSQCAGVALALRELADSLTAYEVQTRSLAEQLRSCAARLDHLPRCPAPGEERG